MKKINIVDMFCGGGGESTGLIEAAHDYNFDVNMSAINHWERAIETHAKNYPFAEHRCENVQHIEPHTLAASKNTDLMWASPGCQHFSVARGGKPRSEDMRSPAWEVLRFAEELRPKRIIIENVPEFRTWGPLDSNGKIIKECKGKTFDAFINGLKSLNYIVDYQVLCAADYGAATSRRRLFIQAVRKDCGKRILWPDPTNTKGGDLLLSDWKPASEIIDWSLPCQIISQRKKPLAAATMRRIEYGIREFWGEAAVPFIARLYGQSNAESIEKPLSTISCSGAHHMLIMPFLCRYNKGDNRVHPINEPVPTLDCSNRYGIVEPFITAIGQTSAKQRNRQITEPLSTICTKQEHCLVQPMLVQYYGTGHAVSIKNPVPTLTTKDRYALVGTDKNGIELGFRMLQPHELAAATGFPKDYVFTGTKVDVVKQIGNAVPPNFAKALFRQVLKEMTN
ncbi:MAG: DNA cytosine methyltransferase [Treponema sp.]|nr:DNA cytosine methyltransferase [Treponema sp.]